MAEKFLLEIVTPYRRFMSKEVLDVTAHALDGEFGVLAGHSPYLIMLKAGEVSYKAAGESGLIAIGRGYAEITRDKTTILVENAETASEIDLKDATESLRDAEEALKKLLPEDPGYDDAVNALELAGARLRVKEKQR